MISKVYSGFKLLFSIALAQTSENQRETTHATLVIIWKVHFGFKFRLALL